MHWFLAILLHGSEIWTFRQKDENHLTTVQMKFYRRTAGYTCFDHKWNKFVLKELKVDPFDEKQRIQIKLAITRSRNKQQHDAKNNTELCTKWKKTTWKTFAGTIRRG
jgi:hypothetical protein